MGPRGQKGALVSGGIRIPLSATTLPRPPPPPPRPSNSAVWGHASTGYNQMRQARSTNRQTYSARMGHPPTLPHPNMNLWVAASRWASR